MSSNISDKAESYKIRPSQRALCVLLSKLNLLSLDQLNSSYNFHDFEPIAFFANLGCFDEWAAIEKVAKELKIQTLLIEKSDKESALKLLDSEELNAIDVNTWRKHRFLPLTLWNKELLVCAANPLDVDIIKKLEFELQLKLKVCVAKEKQILEVYLGGGGNKEALDFKTLLKSEQKGPELKTVTAETKHLESNISKEDITTPVVIKLVNRIFAGSIQKQASDLHISPEQNKVVVRIRVDGIMRHFLDVPENYKDAVIARIKVLCGMDISEKRNAQDGRLRLKTNNGNRDLRISTIPTIHGENIVARILASDLGNISYESLGMSGLIIENVDRSLHYTSKVNLVAGPTGSGKTSTLYAGILRLKDGTSHIITIEDPIEYRLQGINQIQLNIKAGMTFASSLRSILRQDPDIIMVGEIRDSETASIAMQVAQTGHLVLSTIHTNTASAAITRLRDLDVPSFLIASSLGSVLAQRLIRRLCEKCKIPANKELSQRLEALNIKSDGVMQASGCKECDQTGYKSRIGIYSMLNVDMQVAAAIREECSEPEIEAIGTQNGFESLEVAALKLASHGITSIEEIERVLGPLDNKYILDSLTKIAKEKKVIFDQNSLSGGEKEVDGTIHKRKVLVVDDDENIRAIYQMILEYEMFEVEQAENGADALQKIYENPPELILLDLMMPKMNGTEMIEKLRANSQTKDIPVLVLTAAATEENELDLIKKGADDFISKTSKSEIIVARINRLLNR